MNPNPHVARLPYPSEVLGRVDIDAPPTIVAGSMTTVRITFIAGRFGIDDQGSLRFLFRFASDAGRPQFDRPGAPNYCTVTASNGTVLMPEYHPRGAFRPWFKAIRVNVMRDALREGDSVTLVLGDRSQGSAGWRTSSMVEPGFEIRVQADPFGTVVYGDVAGAATLRLVPGEPQQWRLVIPTARRVGEGFALRIRADDRCGNPAASLTGDFRLEADGPLAGLPASIVADGGPTLTVAGLIATAPGTVRIRLRSAEGQLLAESNPLAVADPAADPVGDAGVPTTYWADFHAQSEETIGTNSARDYFAFARDLAFCDIVGHQGNDFQISNAFWQALNALYREFNEPGRFVTMPGYEYSPVTHLGGDRNIFFFDEGRPIRRSSHALVEDMSDVDSDCNHVRDLFAALKRAGERALAFAHVGGRYADLRAGHDGDIERSVEIHSSWGTFEWLLFDAFELGHRVGIVCNSDDHKGRPGASHPGASIFGAYGGLTCLFLPELSRVAVWQALESRHHYGTTGDRLHLAVDACFERPARRYRGDPLLDPAAVADPVMRARMGDIVAIDSDSATVRVSVRAGSPIERIDLRCGARTLRTVRLHGAADLGSRVRIVWEGAEYRGRGRMTTWDGRLAVAGNRITSFAPINFFHLEKRLVPTDDGGLAWESVTTGNFSGADLVLAETGTGEIVIETPHVRATVPVASIGLEDTVFDAGGLGRRLRLFRLPDADAPADRRSFDAAFEVEVPAGADSPVYVRVTLENGHQAWSSPIYLFREPSR